MFDSEKNLKKINEFLACDKQIEKIIEMLIFILKNRSCFPKEAVESIYCGLSFDRNHFGYDYDDDDDFDEDESNQDNYDDLVSHKCINKSLKTEGSITRHNAFFISKLLKIVNLKIQKVSNFL